MTIQSIFKQESTVNNTSGGFSILKRKVCQSYVKTRKTGDINPYNSSKIRDFLKIYTISPEYLTEEKFYPFSTTDKYFTDPYKQYPVMICGQRVILTNGERRIIPEDQAETVFHPILLGRFVV